MTKTKVQDWLCRKGLRRLELWAMEGYTDAEISTLMGIARKTFYQWREKYPAIGNTLTRGRGHATDVVEDELFRRARGQKVILKKTIKTRRVEYDPMTGRKLREFDEPEEVEEEIYVPADVRAQQFFLNCRRPEDWSEQQTVELGDKAAEALSRPALSLSERRALLEDLTRAVSQDDQSGS